MTPVRFLYTSQPGKGFTELVSPDLQLKNWLRENLRQPHSTSYTRTLNRGLSVAVQDGWVICTYLTRQTDDNNRPFIRNHSVLVPEAEYNQLARNFGQSILSHIEESDETALEDGQLRPLGLPQVTVNGLQSEDMEAIANYLGPELERLLASLISGKPFSVRVRGTTEEAIDLATALLKTAALADLPVPQISTFEPSPKTRNWYPSQVLSSPQGRGGIQFQQKNLPDRDAASSARRLVQSVANFDPDGIASSMLTARNHAEVARHYPAATAGSSAAPEAKIVEHPQSNDNETQVYQFNKEYEAALDKKKDELDAQQEILNQQARELLDREKDLRVRLEEELGEREREIDQRERELITVQNGLKEREEDVSVAEAEVRRNASRLGHWTHIAEIFSVLDKHNCPDPEEQVLDRFFARVKELGQDDLQKLDEGVKDFIPSLQKIAESNMSKEKIFLKDLEEIERKLAGKASRFRIL